MSFISKMFGPKRAKASQKEGLASAQQLLRDKIEGDGKIVVYEFERLRQADGGSTEVAESHDNEGKNRYGNVVPFDGNRVRLGKDKGTYINASHLESKEGEVPRWRYIATQGPLKSTISDFWEMVYEQRSSVVIMLTRTVENSHVEKCALYFPTKEGGKQRYGQLSVRNQGQAELSPDITARELLLTHEGSQEARKVMHYYYHAWPDHGVPSTTEPLRQLSALLRATKSEGTPVVHCSAGIGRTGTFCAIDIILRRLQHLDLRDRATAERAIDIKRVVSNLRKQRIGMVQTPGQYLFCHQAVKEEIDELLGVQDVPLSVAVAQSPVE